MHRAAAKISIIQHQDQSTPGRLTGLKGRDLSHFSENALHPAGNKKYTCTRHHIEYHAGLQNFGAARKSLVVLRHA